jgi:hypothetical protein
MRFRHHEQKSLPAVPQDTQAADAPVRSRQGRGGVQLVPVNDAQATLQYWVHSGADGMSGGRIADTNNNMMTLTTSTGREHPGPDLT